MRWYKVMAVGMLIFLGGGCAGVLQETRHPDGKAERLRVESLEGWTSWDHRFTDKHEEMGAVLKREMSF